MDPVYSNHYGYLNIDPDSISDILEDLAAVPDRNRRTQIPNGYLAPGSFLDTSSFYSYPPSYAPLTPSVISSFGAASQVNTQEDGTGRYSVAEPTLPGAPFQRSQQWQQTRIVDPGLSQVPLDPSEDLARILQFKTQFQSLSESIQNFLPRLDEISLLDLKIFLQGTFSGLDTSIQARLDHNAPTPPATRARYRCRLCHNHAKIYQTLGTFKRHVTHTHRAEHIYRCSYNTCTFGGSTRRDKFREHLQQKHNRRPINKNSLDDCRRICPSPASCDVCHVGVSNWKKWFKCVAKHCRLSNGASTTTDISRSRRGSGSSGGDGSDSSDPQSGGGGFNGASPSFEDNQTDGRENDYKDIGYQFGSYHADYSQYTAQAQPGYESLHSTDLPADSHCDLESCPTSDTKDSEGQPVDFGSTNVHSHHLALASTLKRDHLASENSHTLTLQQKSLMPKSDSSSRMDIKRMQLASNDRNLQNGLFKDLEQSFKVKCKYCEHVLEGCIRCEASKGVVRRCHICAGGIRQEIPLHDFLHGKGNQNRVCNLEPKVFASSEESVVKMTQALKTHPLTMSLCGDGHQSNLCTSESLAHNECTSVLFYTKSRRNGLFFSIFRRSNDGRLRILTGNLPNNIDCPLTAYTNVQDAMAILSSLRKFEFSVFPTMLMSKISSRFYRTLLENLVFPLMPFPEKEEWPLSSVSRNAAILKAVQEGLPYFKAEIRMQLLEGSPDSTSPDSAETTSHQRKRSHMLQTRLRVIVKLFKLKTTVKNAQNAQVETERAGVDFHTSSDVILDHPESSASEIVFEVPISETKEFPTTWDLIQGTAIYLKDITTSAHKRYYLEEYDDPQLVATSLIDTLPKLIDWFTPLRVISPE